MNDHLKDPSERAARCLRLASVVPALLVVAWLAVSLPLLLAGVYRAVPAFALFVPVAAGVLWLTLRGRRAAEPVSWWSAGGVLAVGLGFLVVQVVMASEQIIVRRDPAAYMQFALWLTEHGSLPIPQDRAAFGGADPSLGFESPAFYQVGQDVVPQFMAGSPMVLALGGWIGGTHGALLMAPLLGACAVLAFGGLAARLVGPRWAPVAALLLALAAPMVWVSRSTYSELPALVLLLGGLVLLLDMRTERGRVQTAHAFFGGLALGLIVLVRIDGLRDVLPVVVFAGLLAARGRRTALPLAGGLALGIGAGLVEGFVLSRPYLEYLSASVVPLLVISAVLVAATAAMVVLLRWEPTGARMRRTAAKVSLRIRQGPLPGAAAFLTVLAVAAFAARPLVQTVRRPPATEDDRLNVGFIESVQRINDLAVDGTRQYSEISLYWVIWYVGLPALLLAAFGAALLVRRLLRGFSPEWLLPFAIVAWTTVLVLWRPGITPDHPWASRRLIAIVVPGLLLLAVWATDWGVRRIRRMGYGRRATGWAAAAAAALLLVPVVATSGGILVSRTEQGEVAAVDRLCGLTAGASVIVVERATADRFLQIFRSMCGVPAARLVPGSDGADVRRVAAAIRAAGRRPVVVGAERGQVAPYGTPVHAIRLRTRQDERTLVEPPNATWSLSVDVWLVQYSRRA